MMKLAEEYAKKLVGGDKMEWKEEKFLEDKEAMRVNWERVIVVERKV